MTLGAAPNVEVAFTLAPRTVIKRVTSPVGTIIIGAGAAFALGAGAYHLLALRPARNDAANATTQIDYEAALDRFHHRRTITTALYGGAAATLAIGVVLKLTVFEAKDVEVLAAPAPGGGAVSLEWHR